MKKPVLLCFLTIFLLVTSACKREWTCQCVATDVHSGVTVDVQHHPIKDATQKEAKSECLGLETKTEVLEVECQL